MEALMNRFEIKKYMNKYKLLKTDEEKVKLCMEFLYEFEKISELMLPSKDAKISINYKKEANKLYTCTVNMTRRLDEIIEIYTKSVAYAPTDSQELSIAFANRSAALFKGKLYDESLKDITRALDLDYPANLKAKLLSRKAQCLVMLDAKTTEVEKTIKEARMWLKKMDENSAGKQVVKDVLDNPIRKDAFPEQKKLLDDERNLPPIPRDNPEIPGASAAVAINHSAEFGRHIIATRDIEPGEVIAIDEGFVSVLKIKKYYTNCWNCTKQTWSGIPCKFCVDIIYCSEKCRQEAWENHHDMECQTLGLLNKFEPSSFSALCMKSVILVLKQAGSIEKLQNDLKIIESHQDPRTKGFTNNVFDSSYYTSFYSLVASGTNGTLKELFVRSLSCAYMVFFLWIKNKNIFGEQLESKSLIENPRATFVGGLAQRNFQIIAINAHSIYEECSLDSVKRGSTLMPFISLFNHSCFPQCSRVSSGKYMIQSVTCSIKKGEQIFDNYGNTYAGLDKFNRQLLLKNYYKFDCQCVACTENWPIRWKLPKINNLSLAPKIKVKALSISQRLMQYGIEDVYGNFADEKKTVEDLKGIIKYFEKNIPPPFEEFYLAYFILSNIYNRQGNLLQTLNY